MTDTLDTEDLESTNGKRPNALVRLYRGETHFDFVGRRRWWYAISGTIILAGLISLGVRGLNLGIDFKGGTQWLVPSQTLTLSQATSAVQKVGVTPSVVQSLGVGAERSIKVEADLSHVSAARQASEKTAITNALAGAADVRVDKLSVDDVGATWGSTVTNKAIEAMIVFFILVTIYIAVRFQWRMAVAALLKVVLHDLAITIGIFSLTNFQVTPNGVIAVLTIMGYSLYDTVVVFDKINENTKGFGAAKRGGYSYAQVVNLSLNQVLARSLNTSLVAVLPVLSVLIIGAQLLGADTLRQFGFPLVIGLVAGAYSSIFIAAPVPGGMRAARAALAGGGGRQGQEILTPKAAAALLAGPGAATRAGRGVAPRGRQQGQVLRPGAGGARRAPAAVTDDDEWADDDAAAPASPARAGTAARSGTGARSGGGGASGARRPPPRPRKGGGKGRKGGRRR